VARNLPQPGAAPEPANLMGSPDRHELDVGG